MAIINREDYLELLEEVRNDPFGTSSDPFTPSNLVYNEILNSEFSKECANEFKVTPYTKFVVIFDFTLRTFLVIRPQTPKYLITPESKFFMRTQDGAVLANITDKKLGETFIASDTWGHRRKFRVTLIDNQ